MQDLGLPFVSRKRYEELLSEFRSLQVDHERSMGAKEADRRVALTAENHAKAHAANLQSLYDDAVKSIYGLLEESRKVREAFTSANHGFYQETAELRAILKDTLDKLSKQEEPAKEEPKPDEDPTSIPVEGGLSLQKVRKAAAAARGNKKA